MSEIGSHVNMEILYRAEGGEENMLIKGKEVVY